MQDVRIWCSEFENSRPDIQEDHRIGRQHITKTRRERSKWQWSFVNVEECNSPDWYLDGILKRQIGQTYHCAVDCAEKYWYYSTRATFNAVIFFLICSICIQPVLHLSVYHGIFTVLYLFIYLFYVVVLLYVSSVVWWGLQGLVTFRLFLQHVVDVLD